VEISIVGAGTVGTALALLLQRAGHRIVAASGRGSTAARLTVHLPDVPLLDASQAASAGDVVLLGTPDDRIAEVCRAIAFEGGFGPSRSVAHLSGAIGLEVLDPAVDAGASVLCLHPLQTFPDVEAALGGIPGASFAITAREDGAVALGERLARDAGGEPFVLAEEVKPLYHAAAVFASNYLVALTAIADELFAAAGVDHPIARFLPLSRASLDHAAALGPERALTGPAVRGDAGTVERNLLALSERAPQAVAAYVALARVALDLGERSGRLDPAGRARVEEVLGRWT
jgi:predicted short-subunit dehydrogenase-like oxidoreductase (DUF2520 family)